MRIRLGLIILSVAAAVSLGAGRPATAAETGAEGREWGQLVASLPQRWTDPAELARQVTAFLKRRPGSAHARAGWYMVGEAYRRTGQYAPAAEFYDRARRQGAASAEPGQAGVTPDFGDSIEYRLGECLFNLQKHAEAQDAWQACLAHYPDTFLRGEILQGLGQSLLAQRRWEDAGRRYAELLKQSPAYAAREDVAVALSTIDYHRGATIEAIKRLQNPETIPGQYLKGLVLQALEKYVDAANYFNRIVKSGQADAPLFKNAFYQRGEAFLQAKDYVSAVKSASNFLEKYPPGDPFAPYLKHQQAVIFFELKQYAKTLQVLGALAGNKAFPREALDYLSAECYIRGEQVPKAEALYRKLALSTDPEVRQAAGLKQGWCAYTLKRYPEALKFFAEYTKSYPADEHLAAVSYLTGRCEALQGHDEAALKIFQALVEKPGDPLLADLSLLQFQAAAQRLGRTEELVRVSERYLGQAEKRLPDEAKLPRALNIFYLGRAQYLRGNYSQSIDGWQRLGTDFWDTPVYPYALEGIVRSLFQEKNFEACAKAALAGLREKQLPPAVAQDLQLLLAHALFNQKKIEEALPQYQKWVEKNPAAPQLPQILYLMGRGYMQIKFYKNALETWDRVITKYRRLPLCEPALAHSAQLYLDGREFKKAVALYQRLLAEWPQTSFAPQARLAIAQSYLAQEDYGAAKTAYQDFLTRYPTDARAAESAQNLEIVAFQEAVKIGTPEAFSAFLTQFPQSQYGEKVQYLVGEMYYGRKQYAQALVEFSRMSQNYPNGKLQPQALYLAAECADLSGNTAAAVAGYQAFVRGFGGHELMPEVLFRLGVDYFQMQDLKSAVQTFRDCADRFPKSKSAPQALYNLIPCYTQLQQEQDLMNVLTALAERYPAEPEGREALARLGKYYHEQKAYPQAVSYLAVLVAGGGALPAEICYRLGDSYENLKEPQKAMKLYAAARRCKPADDVFRIVALSQLAALYEQSQRLGEALGVYKDIAKNTHEEQWRTAAAERIQLLRRYLNESGD